MRFCCGFVIAALGVLAVRDGRISVWTGWTSVWVGCIGGSVARTWPDWRSWRRRRLDGPGREVTRSTSDALTDWIRGEVRRAGISDRRSGGGGTVLTEPVLISWTTGYSRFATAIYDQHGNLLATAAKGASAWQSLRASSWKSFGGRGDAEFVDARGTGILTVLMAGAGKRWELSVVGGDGDRLGGVSLANHSIISHGEVVGWVRRMGPWGLPWGGRRFAIEDAQKSVVGHVTRTRSSGLWSTCNVTEFDEQAPAAVRALALAIDEAVTVWLAPKGGGG